MKLGKIVEAEQTRGGAGDHRGNVQNQKAKLRKRHQQARQEQFEDLGFQ